MRIARTLAEGWYGTMLLPVQKSEFGRRSAGLAGLACALLLGAAATTGCSGQKAEAPPTTLVRAGLFESVLEEVGVIEATRTISFVATRRAKLIHLAESGTHLEVGDLVYQLENEDVITDIRDEVNQLKTVKADLESNVESLRIALRSNTLDLDLAEAQLAYNRVRLEDVNIKLAETEVLLQRSVVPEDDLRDARYNVESNRLQTVSTNLDQLGMRTSARTEETDGIARIERSVLEAEKAQRDIKDARRKLDESKVIAPVSGLFVRSRTWSWREQKMTEPRPGDDVREGHELGSLPDMSALVVRTQIPESYLTRVSEGGPVDLVFDAYEGLNLKGTISNIGRVAIEREASPAGSLMQSQAFSGQKVFEVTIDVEGDISRLKPGVTANVRFVLAREADVLTVPVGSVRVIGGETFVQVLDEATGKIRDQAIQTDRRDNDRVIVTSGLRSGDRVVTSPKPQT